MLPLLELPLSARRFESTGLGGRWEYVALFPSWCGKPVCAVSWDFLTLLTEDLPLQMYSWLRAVVLSPVRTAEVTCSSL